ncbi:hypothetical protein BGT96224_Ac31480 [Blumeria graminis f. sp. tritici 96224]|nr:hypothetical protein BGT96224_Ac31480 [Blumeria graminis f. sp. tritici 96224]
MPSKLALRYLNANSSSSKQKRNSIGQIELLEEQDKHTMAEATVAITPVALTKAQVPSAGDPPIIAKNPLETRSATSPEKQAAGPRLIQFKNDDQHTTDTVIRRI